MLKGKSCIALVIILILGLFLAGCPPKPAPPPAPVAPAPEPVPLPKMIAWTSFDVGSATYIVTAGLGEAIEKLTGMKVKVIPVGVDLARILPVKKGEAHVFSVSGGTHWLATQGREDFAAADWGPQRLRILWRTHEQEGTMVVRGTAPITTGHDLKGKRVTFVPGAPVLNAVTEGILSFFGLTWGDVVKTIAPGYAAAIRMVIDGAADAAFAVTISAICYELEASPHGIRWIYLPHADKAGWERLQKHVPFVYPAIGYIGAGIDPAKRQELLGYDFPLPGVYPHLEEHVAYAITRAIHLGYPIFKEKYPPSTPRWTLENALAWVGKIPTPYHPGAVKYFKEIGAWTDKDEKYQAELLRLEEERIKAWEKATAEAKAKGIPIDPKDTRWLDLWYGYLAKIR